MLTVSFSPFPILHTPRLLLREITLADTNAMLMLRSNKLTLEFLDKKPLESASEATLLINKILKDLAADEGITWAISLKEKPGDLIGTIGLWRLVKEHYRAEIGYMLLPDFFKKGYMKEAIYTILDFGFNKMNLHSIEAHINPANQGSKALLLSQGFVEEGYFRENFYFAGHFKDTAVYSLLQSRFNTDGKIV